MLSPNELTRILEEIDEVSRRGERAALVTVVSVSGSAYRRPGARMLVRESGRISGGVSGGCLEADVIRRAQAAMLNGRPAVATYDAMDEEDGTFGSGLGCRGEITVLIEPTSSERALFHVDRLRRMLERREPSVLALSFGGSESELGAFAQFPDDAGRAHVELEESARDVLQRRRWRCESGVLLEYLAPLPRLLVVGGGPDSEPLAACAHALGYRVTIADHRPGYLSRRQFPRETRTSAAPIDHLSTAEVDAFTACIVATHNVSYDEQALTRLLSSDAGYIGILGPRDRTARLLSRVQSRLELRPRHWERLHAPTGLDIGADTPEQIALSILAEIQAVMAGRSGGFLRDRAAPIHDDVRVDDREATRLH